MSADVEARCEACGAVMAESGCEESKPLVIRSDRTGKIIKTMTTGWCCETGEWAR